MRFTTAWPSGESKTKRARGEQHSISVQSVPNRRNIQTQLSCCDFTLNWPFSCPGVPVDCRPFCGDSGRRFVPKTKGLGPRV